MELQALQLGLLDLMREEHQSGTGLIFEMTDACGRLRLVPVMEIQESKLVL